MSTNANVKFIVRWGDSEQQEYVNTYHHYDGYIEGVGINLAKFIMSKRSCNGIGPEDSNSNNIANGIGDLAAQYVAANKHGVGNFYIEPMSSTQQWSYDVIVNLNIYQCIGPENPVKADDTIIIRVKEDNELVFEGKASELYKKYYTNEK